MKLKISIDPSTTNSELVHLGNFLTALGMNRGAHVISAPIDEAELDEPEPTCIPLNREEPVVHAEVPKRKRRTKAEIAAAAEEEASAPTDPAPTPPVEPPATPPSETASTEPASASPSEGGKTYTHAEVQALAVDTARRYGPEKVKALIATYPNATKIVVDDSWTLIPEDQPAVMAQALRDFVSLSPRGS